MLQDRGFWQSLGHRGMLAGTKTNRHRVRRAGQAHFTVNIASFPDDSPAYRLLAVIEMELEVRNLAEGHSESVSNPLLDRHTVCSPAVVALTASAERMSSVHGDDAMTPSEGQWEERVPQLGRSDA